MDEKQLDKRFHLDAEIRELVSFANSTYGIEGVNYVQVEIARILESISNEELPIKK